MIKQQFTSKDIRRKTNTQNTNSKTDPKTYTYRPTIFYTKYRKTKLVI